MAEKQMLDAMKYRDLCFY